MTGDRSEQSGRLVILTGPSGIGKSPLAGALRRLYPQRTEGIQPLVLYNSRLPRPGERDGWDYHFRSREAIDAMRGREDCLVREVRGDLQALDLAELGERLAGADVLYEGNPNWAQVLCEQAPAPRPKRLSVFISPLSVREIRCFQDVSADLRAIVADVMRRKLLRRTRAQKGELSQPDLQEVEWRCGSAYDELKQAWRFDHVLANHDGEDSENWTAFGRPIGDAGRTVRAVANLLAGKPADTEPWQRDLLE